MVQLQEDRLLAITMFNTVPFKNEFKKGDNIRRERAGQLSKSWPMSLGEWEAVDKQDVHRHF